MKNIIAITLALPLLLVVPTLMSGCASTRMTGERADDARIEARVGRRLARDPDIKRRDIDADVINRVVTLRGKVDNPESAQEAVRIAENTKGVERVINELEIEPGGQVSRDGDMGIKTRIGTQLMADPNVRRMNVDVDVIDGVVYLSGIVEDQEAKDAAERIASNVDGVVRVQNELQISPEDDTMSKDKQMQEKKTPATGRGRRGQQQGGQMQSGQQQGGQMQGGQQPEGGER